MRITRKHKLYFRNPSNNALNRLDKFFPELYVYVIKLFLEGDANKRYTELNEGVENWRKIKPIDQWVPDELINPFFKKFGKHEVVFSYNVSWKPLIRMTIEPRKR